jgi:aldehyde dehydrogenase (NAD+)
MPTLTKAKTAALKQYIGGKWIPGGGSELVSTNPADTRDVLARFQIASTADAQKAIAAAEKAFPAWRDTPAPQRGRVLAKAAEIFRKRSDELAALMTREQGKILPEAKGEMAKGITLLDWYAGEGMRLMGTTAPSELPKNLLYTVRQPLGVVSIITPWNFPFAIPAWKIAPALLAGNAVVFKPSPLIPAFSDEFVKVFEEAGLPPGILNLLNGADAEVGQLLVNDNRVKAVSFTGSTAVGLQVSAAAGARGIKVTCEMGGKNPAIIMDDADLNLALGGVIKGAFGSTGQRCTATSRLLLHEKIADQFIKMLSDEMKKIKVGNGMDPATGMGPAVDENQLKTDLKYIELAKKEGAKLVFGGRRLEEGELKHGWFVEPTLFDNVKPTSRLYREEVFGPVLAVARFKNDEQMIELANACEFGLTCAIYTQDLTRAMNFIDRIEAGMVHVNSATIGGEAQVPFGGVKGSGVGDREMSKEGLHFFTELKTVFLDYTGQRRSSNLY